MASIRIIAHLENGESVFGSAKIESVARREMRISVTIEEPDFPLHLYAIDRIDGVMRDGRQVLELKGVSFAVKGRSSKMEFDIVDDDEPLRGTPEVERVFENLGFYMTRLVANGWSDRSLGRYAPKMNDDDDATDKDEDEAAA